MLVTSFASYVLVVTTSITGLSPTASAACTYSGAPFHIYEKKHSIESSGFPNQYYGNEDCDWYLNPPVGTLPELLVVDLVVETNVEGIPEATNVCHRTKNYLNIAHARACGKEGPICVLFMLRTSGDMSCHWTIAEYFSHCTTVLTGGWPTKVTFRTVEPDTKMGFQMNYTFVECGVNLDEKEQTTAQSTTEVPISRNVTGSGAGKNSTESAFSTSTTKTTTTASTTTTTTFKSERTPVTNRKTTSKQQPKSTTMKLLGETQGSAPQNRNLILTIVLVLVCVIFCIIVIAVIFRKRLRAWVSEKAPQPNRSQNGSNASYIDAYVIPLEKSRTYEQPIPQGQPPVPPPYRSPSTSTDTSNSATYDKLSNAEKGKKNENNNCVGTIENYAYDTTET